MIPPSAGSVPADKLILSQNSVKVKYLLSASRDMDGYCGG